MKYLSNYIEEEQSKLFEECGVFFAFSKKQFEEEAKKVGANAENKVVGFGAGGYVLKKNFEKFAEEMGNIRKRGITKDIEENGIDAIIQRELANYECQIGGNWGEAYNAIADYDGITEEMVKEGYKKFYEECVKNDWF